MIDINQFTETEDRDYCKKINDDFVYFSQAIPDIRISEEFIGKTLKLRTPINNDGTINWGSIFFELQWMLYRYREKNSDLIVDKMLVSKLKLTSASVARELNVSRGLIITICYQSQPAIKAPLSN